MARAARAAVRPRQSCTGRGPLGVGEALINRWARLAVRAKIKWKRNALRHSFGSYRPAVTADLARVSAEMGNSPAIINEHYRALVTEAEGKAWFGILPALAAAGADVVPMPRAGT